MRCNSCGREIAPEEDYYINSGNGYITFCSDCAGPIAPNALLNNRTGAYLMHRPSVKWQDEQAGQEALAEVVYNL